MVFQRWQICCHLIFASGSKSERCIFVLCTDGWIKLGVTEGYTEEDYQNFKRTALVATTSYATNAKEGCENEFAIFVETDPDLYLPNLSEYITFKKEEEINVIDISDCTEILSAMKDRIKNVEVYYNPYTTKLVSAIEEAKIYNIVTQKEV